MIILECFLTLILGIFTGSLITLIYFKRQQHTLQLKVNEFNSLLKFKETENQWLLKQNTTAETKLEPLRLKILELEKEISRMGAHNKNLENQVKTIEQLDLSIERKLEHLMIKVYDDSQDRISKASKEQWTSTMYPLKEEILKLKTTVTETYQKGARETLVLANQIEHMTGTFENIKDKTDSLTKALRGDSKTQGDWGEMILERLIENAGLTEGREFITQGKGLGLKTEDGKVLKPDMAILLPKERNIIIDSKVSIVSYEKYISAGDEREREVAGKELLLSINRHIDDLAKKDYTSLYQLNSPDYVLMFIPNDGVFALATSLDSNLYARAMTKGINLVSPSFLLPSLRLVHNIWQGEKQTKNALKIAEEAGKLYDKFVFFTKELEKIREHLKKADDATEGAFKKMSEGRGSLVTKAHKLKILGAKAKKDLHIKGDYYPSLEQDIE